jgi:hypothetical protein
VASGQEIDFFQHGFQSRVRTVAFSPDGQHFLTGAGSAAYLWDMASESQESYVKANCRRMLLMVQELHGMGYQRLRAVPGISSSGFYWRVAITPATNIRPSRCGEREVNWDEDVTALYTSGSVEKCFGWEDAAKDSPKQLADKFVKRFPTIVAEGKGSDPDYSRWYAAMIEATEPKDVIIMYADWEMPTDHVPVPHKETRVPLPPQVNSGPAGGERLWCDSKAPSVVLDTGWLTRNVVGLAKSIHDEHAFDRLPILGDALEDVGCTSADILKHCRQGGKHVRGCSLIDLLLGKRV